MAQSLYVQKTLQIRYSYARIQWLIGAVSLGSLLYLTSDEIWRIADKQPFPEITSEGAICYMLSFLVILMFVHFYDARRIVLMKSVAIVTSLISIIIDLSVLCLFEFLTLYALQVLPQDYLQCATVLLLGAMPICLGSIVLSSLTAETLKKRTKELLKEIKEIGGEIEKLEDQRKKTMEDLKSFEKKKKEFEKYFEKQNQDEEVEMENDKR
jgi:hypothetical protein